MGDTTFHPPVSYMWPTCVGRPNNIVFLAFNLIGYLG